MTGTSLALFAIALVRDAWGNECVAMVPCIDCNGTGTDYGETCLRCGGCGEHCPPERREAPGKD